VSANPLPAGPEAVARSGDSRRRRLEDKIEQHAGVTKAMAADPEVARVFGYEGSMPGSTLQGRLHEMGLWERVEEARRQRRKMQGRELPELETLVAAIRRHRSATEAARSLGIHHGVLVWQLRRAGLTVRGLLRGTP
jgi:hypothetical protein